MTVHHIRFPPRYYQDNLNLYSKSTWNDDIFPVLVVATEMEILMGLGKDDITEKMAKGSDFTQIGLAYKIRGLVLCWQFGLKTSRIPGLNYCPSQPLSPAHLCVQHGFEMLCLISSPLDGISLVPSSTVRNLGSMFDHDI